MTLAAVAGDPAPVGPLPVQRAVVPISVLDGQGASDPEAPDSGAGRGGIEIGELTTEVNRQLAIDDAELAGLARRLYPQLRDELRFELRVQRERAGLLGDPL